MDDVELANVIAGASDGPIKVGAIERTLAKAIGAKTRMVHLSRYTIDKQKFTHKHIGFPQYCLLPAILLNGYVMQNSDRLRYLVYGHYLRFPEKIFYQLVLKGSRAGDKINVESFHRISHKEYRRLRRKGQKQGLLLRDSTR